MTNETKVKVTYYDDSSRETTVGELRTFLNGESPEWFNWFFEQLEKNGKQQGKFAMYTLEQ